MLLETDNAAYSEYIGILQKNNMRGNLVLDMFERQIKNNNSLPITNISWTG